MSSRTDHPRCIVGPRRGFTLLEVLISIALILALFGAMFGFLFDMLSTRSRVMELTAQQRAASLLIDRLEADLLTCLVGDSRNGAGVQGDEHSLRLLVRSTAPGNEDDAAFSDLQRIEYRFDAASHSLTGSRGPARNDAIQPNSFGARLYKVRFRYHDGQAWLNQFDSLQQDRLPVAVEVAVWFDPWPGDEWSDEGEQIAGAGPGGMERLTFDMGDTFDEREWAMRADRDFRDDPIPDRVRVIAVPDAMEGGNE